MLAILPLIDVRITYRSFQFTSLPIFDFGDLYFFEESAAFERIGCGSEFEAKMMRVPDDVGELSSAVGILEIDCCMPEFHFVDGVTAVDDDAEFDGHCCFSCFCFLDREFERSIRA